MLLSFQNSMDSKLYGMPLSTAQDSASTPKIASGIRAPLTTDSDFEFEYSSSQKGSANGDNSSYNSGSESEEGFLSGEDGFETPSERPFMADPDEYVVSRPFVKFTGEKNFQENSSVSGYGEFRPFVSTPDDTFEASSNLGEYYDSRPYLTDQDEEIVGDNFQVGKNGDFIRPSVAYTDRVVLRVPVEMENEYTSDVNVEGPQVDGRIDMVSKQSMPIAQVSGDSDDGSVHSEILEDDGCSSFARIPDALVLERFNSAPKVKLLEVEEEEGIDSQSENLSEAEVVKDLISAGDENGVLSSEDKEELIVVKDIVHGFKSAEVVEDKKVLVVTEDVKSDSLVGSHEQIMLKELVDRGVLCSDEEIQGLQNDIGIMKSVDLEKNTEHTDHANGIDEELEGSKLIGAESSNNQVEEIKSTCGSLELNLQEMEGEATAKVGDGISLRTLHDARKSEDNYINVDRTVILGQESDNEELESRNEQKTDWMIEAHVHVSASKNDSLDSSSRENEIQNIFHVESPKEPAVQDSMQSIGDYSPDITQSDEMTGELLNEHNNPEPVLLDPNLVSITADEAEDDPNKLVDKEIDSFMHNDAVGLTFKESYAEEQEMEQFNQSLAPASDSAEEISENHLEMDGQIITDSDEEVERDDEYQSEKVFDSAAFAALLKAATGAGSDGGRVTLKTADGNRTYTLKRPGVLGSTFSPMRPTVQPDHSSVFPPAESDDILSEEAKKKLEKLQGIRVNYLRLLHRLNRSLEDPIAARVLYKLLLAAGRPSAQAFSLDSAKKVAVELEVESNTHLNFSLNILVIGKTGVGKSATINSIFCEERATVDAFEPTTTHVKEINGIVNGVKIQVLDTPGLRSSLVEQSLNHKILSSIKKAMKKFSPDVVLYVDRLDVQTRDLNDLPLLKLVTKYLGSSIWHNAIITLTHAASTPPDGPYGNPLSYEAFVAQRSRVVQQLINHSVSDVHLITPGHMSPVSLVENDLYQKNENDQTLLPSGENWRSQLMLQCYSTKVLSEITSVVKTQDTTDHAKLFGYRIRSPPLLYFLTSLLQTNVHPKLSTEQGVEDGDLDIELTYSSESDQEDEEYDQLPPFKPLRKSQIAKLSKDQQKAYFEEYDYRVRLLQKKQWREEVKRIREMKKGKARRRDYSYTEEDGNQEIESQPTIAVPLPDMILPPSFGGDNPSYRYRFLEPSSQLLTRPVLDSHGWDHDCGYDGVSIEDTVAIANRFPAVIAVQLTKDKKEFNINLNSSVSAKHGENGSTMAALDIQTVGKQLAYILKSELKVRNCKINETAAGLSVTFLGKNVVTGLKVEDQIAIGKRLALVGNAGFTCSQGNAAYGANLDVRLREKDYPIGQDQSTVSLSAMRWKGDTVWGCNLQSQFSVGRNSKIDFRAGLNNKMSGQISVRTSSSDQLQIAMLALIPIAKAIYRKICVHSCENTIEDAM